MTDRLHSALPWTACKGGNCQCGFIWDASGEIHVASVHDEKAIGADWYGSDVAATEGIRQANANLIVTAVNSYHALVAVRDVAKALLENHWWVEDCGTALEDHLFMKLDAALSDPALKQARAA